MKVGDSKSRASELFSQHSHFLFVPFKKNYYCSLGEKKKEAVKPSLFLPSLQLLNVVSWQ